MDASEVLEILKRGEDSQHHSKEELAQSGLSLLQILNNLNLAKQSNLNLAGLLLFGKDPNRYKPAFMIKAMSFVGNDPTGDRYRDRERCDYFIRYKGAAIPGNRDRDQTCIKELSRY